MQDAGRAVRDRLGQFAIARPGLMARLRLFGLLVLLAPLFAGLQLMLGDGATRVEVRIVSQDVPIIVPVERIVERVVERIIYVPAPADGTPTPGNGTPTPTVGPSTTPTPVSADPRGAGAPSAGHRGPGAVGSGALTAIGAGLASAVSGIPIPAGAGAGVLVPAVPAAGVAASVDARPPEGATVPSVASGSVRPALVRRAVSRFDVMIATKDRLGGGGANQESASRMPGIPEPIGIKP